MTSELLHLTVLGCATPCPSVDNPCSGYLVSGGDTRVWVDAGSGTLAELQRHVPLDDLDAIWISHMHADHSADLLTAYYGALFAMSCATARLVKRIRRGCGSCDSLTRLAEGCDALLCEAESAQAPTEGEQVHHTPEDAGETAGAAGAGRLIVTHVGRFLTPQQAVARASARFDGPIDYASPGATFSIGTPR